MTAASHALLLVEDEVMLRAIAAEMLQDAGFPVFEAGDGVEALELLKSNPQISLLISDVRMPRMGGYELVMEGLQVNPALKVLLMTGYAEDPPGEIARRTDIQILRKPFNLDLLCSLASDLLKN